MSTAYQDPLASYDRDMQRLAMKHAPFKVDVPEGRSGSWEVIKREMGHGIEALRCWRDGRPVPPGTYTVLKNDTAGLFMSDTPAELWDAEELITRAYGHVLISGLGLGMIPRALLMDRAGFEGPRPTPVQRITIVELEQDVVNLVGPTLTDPRIQIVQGDAFTWVPPRGMRFDWAWHDIWPGMCTDYLPEMARLRKHYRGRMNGSNQQLCWGEEEMLS